MIEPSGKLLDLIYDAASEQELWSAALAEIADLTGSLGGFMIAVDLKAQSGITFSNARMSDESHRVYRERHFINPWTPYMFNCPAAEFVQSDDLVPLHELQRTAFFDEVLRPQGMAHNAMVKLIARTDFSMGFNICRSERQGRFDVDHIRLFSQLTPHIDRALKLGFRLDGYRELQQGQYAVLDRVTAGIVLLDRRARILYANSAARALDGEGLSLRNSTVATNSLAHSKQLDRLIQRALLEAPTGVMSVPRPGDGGLLTVVVSSVRGRDLGRLADLGMRDAAVLLYIVDPANKSGVPAAWIMDAYGLTRAEAKVAIALSSGAAMSEVAAQLGLSPNTVKTHLGRVFAKTGTTRQAELARLMASIGQVSANGFSSKDGS